MAALAVIGDWMVPLLMAGQTKEEQDRALPHARDLGLAFQLTNMIRDVNEDLDLRRQYLTESVFLKYNVDVRARQATASFTQALDECIAEADRLYESGDIGIELLPAQSRHLIRVARLIYHRIHDEIRNQGYAIFSGRVTVRSTTKMKMALRLVPMWSVARIVMFECLGLILGLWECRLWRFCIVDVQFLDAHLWSCKYVECCGTPFRHRRQANVHGIPSDVHVTSSMFLWMSCRCAQSTGAPLCIAPRNGLQVHCRHTLWNALGTLPR